MELFSAEFIKFIFIGFPFRVIQGLFLKEGIISEIKGQQAVLEDHIIEILPPIGSFEQGIDDNLLLGKSNLQWMLCLVFQQGQQEKQQGNPLQVRHEYPAGT